MAIKAGWQGRFFEDFEVGDIYRHPLGRTITEADNIWFTLLTMNTNQLHFNEEYGKRSMFGRCVVNSAFTIALVSGMSVTDVSENAAANLGWDEVRLPNPLFVGDTVFAQSEVLEKRESQSRPYAGIVTIRTRGLNQNGDVVIDFKRTMLVYKREGSPRRDIFPEPRVAGSRP